MLRLDTSGANSFVTACWGGMGTAYVRCLRVLLRLPPHEPVTLDEAIKALGKGKLPFTVHDLGWQLLKGLELALEWSILAIG